MTTSTHNRVARAAGRSLALAFLAVLLWGGGGSALALTLGGQAGTEMAVIEPSAQALNPQLGQPLPLTWVDERPDPRAATAPGASQVFGSQFNLAFDAQSSLASSVYFSKSLPLFEALRAGTLFGPTEVEPGVMALRGAGAEHVLDRGRALQQKLAYSTGALQLQGSYLDVDKDFRVPGGSGVSVVGDRSRADALAALRGMREMQFQAQYNPSSALALTTSQRTFTNEQTGHAEVGMSVTEAAHALTYQLGGGRQFTTNFQSRDEDWRGHGAINTQKMTAQLSPSSRLALNYSYDWSNIQREGNQYKGRDLTDVKQGLAYQLTGRTRLDVNFNQVREAWDRGGKLDVTDKTIRDYALHHNFGGGTKADLVRNFTSVTTNGATTGVDTTGLHFEGTRGRINLATDWMDRSRSDGSAEGLTQLALTSAVGAGRTKTALTGLYKLHSDGFADKQVDRLYQFGMSIKPSPLAQLSANYESFDQHGPQADHSYVRTKLGFASQFTSFARLTADYWRETDRDAVTQANHTLKLELTPRWVTLSGGLSLKDEQGQTGVKSTFGDMRIKLGRPLADWARAIAGADVVTGGASYGLRGTPAWAAPGDGAVALSYIGRSSVGATGADTRGLGYQTMLGPKVYVKLTDLDNPMVTKDNKLVMQQAGMGLYETGVNLGRGFAALGRFVRENDVQAATDQRAEILALRGKLGSATSFTTGVQTMQAQGGAPTDWRFGVLNFKLGRPLADWARTASDGGVFDDNTKYGYRKLPTWAAFTDGGLSLQYLERQAEGGVKMIASAAGCQTMLGGRTYARLSLQQNPLNEKGEVIPADRKLFEVGRRFGGKFMALARYTTDDNLAEAKSLRTSMLGLRGRLSERERLETVVVFDDVHSRDERNRTTTYGVEYAREVDDGHYLVIKGTFSDGGAPGGILNGPDVYQIDFAYKKAI